MNSDRKMNGLKNTSLLIVLGLLAFSIFMATDGLSQELPNDQVPQTVIITQ